MRVALDGRHKAGDPRCGFLNLRGDSANRTFGCHRPKCRVERRPGNRFSNPVEGVERHGGFRKRSRDSRVQIVTCEPVGKGILAFGRLNRRQHAVRARDVAGLANGIDRGQLGVGQPRRAKRACRPFGLFHAGFEQRRATLDGRRRVVQLVGQSSR